MKVLFKTFFLFAVLLSANEICAQNTAPKTSDPQATPATKVTPAAPVHEATSSEPARHEDAKAAPAAESTSSPAGSPAPASDKNEAPAGGTQKMAITEQGVDKSKKKNKSAAAPASSPEGTTTTAPKE
ncbi:MAG TPA: hypothetical protein VF868_05720 [Bacteroidia bacterium]